MHVPPLTWLYAPAHRPELVEKAIASDAHAVVVDLEDAVAPSDKARARATVAGQLAAPASKPIFVRINGLGTKWWHEDLAAVSGTSVAGITIPKVESRDDVTRVCGACDSTWNIECLLESALGVLRAFEIASHPRVTGIALGEADLAAETGAGALDWPRTQIIFAAVAAGLPRPPQGVYTNIGDLDGLRASCAVGRALGHLGRRAIHPSQLPVIVDAYLPTAAEVARAEEVAAGGAGGRMAGERFIDAAALKAAEATLALARVYGTAA